MEQLLARCLAAPTWSVKFTAIASMKRHPITRVRRYAGRVQARDGEIRVKKIVSGAITRTGTNDCGSCARTEKNPGSLFNQAKSGKKRDTGRCVRCFFCAPQRVLSRTSSSRSMRQPYAAVTRVRRVSPVYHSDLRGHAMLLSEMKGGWQGMTERTRKLTDADVKDIISRFSYGESATALAQEYGVSSATR